MDIGGNFIQELQNIYPQTMYAVKIMTLFQNILHPA